MKRLKNKGFTIIELLIATVVFSVVLLVITSAVVQFGRLYYKGVIQSRTQETARSVMQEVTQSVQFSKDSPVHSPATGDGVLCIGDKRYTYRLGKQLGAAAPSIPHVLVSDVNASCGSGYSGMATADLSGGAREMLGERMQLVKLEVMAAGPGLWQITVHVAYGEDGDLLPDKSGCQPVIFGGQFCAVSVLTTTVSQRLK